MDNFVKESLKEKNPGGVPKEILGKILQKNFIQIPEAIFRTIPEEILGRKNKDTLERIPEEILNGFLTKFLVSKEIR